MSWIKLDGYTLSATGNGCLICCRGDVRQGPEGREPILSTGFFDEWLGTPEICATCIGEAAQMLGWISNAVHVHEVTARKQAQAELTELKLQLTEKSAALRSVVNELSASMANEITEPGGSHSVKKVPARSATK